MNDKSDLATATVRFQSFSYPKAFQARNLCGHFSKASSGALPRSLVDLFSLSCLDSSKLTTMEDAHRQTLPGASCFFPSLTSEEPADSIGGIAALCGDGLAVRAALV